MMKGTFAICNMDSVSTSVALHYAHLKEVKSIMCYLLGKLWLETATLITCPVTRDMRHVIATATAEDET